MRLLPFIAPNCTQYDISDQCAGLAVLCIASCSTDAEVNLVCRQKHASGLKSEKLMLKKADRLLAVKLSLK